MEKYFIKYATALDTSSSRSTSLLWPQRSEILASPDRSAADRIDDLGHMGVDRAAMNRAVFAALKPGGVYVVADHSGRAGSGISEAGTLHRIEEAFLRREIESAGFRVEPRVTSSAMWPTRALRQWRVRRKAERGRYWAASKIRGLGRGQGWPQ